MNRDERRARLEGPLHSEAAHCYPTDESAGGTWCGINQHGMIFCLLNRYDAPVSNDAAIVSRGGIIPILLTCTDFNDVRSRLSALNFERYNGFRLLALSREVCEQHDWDRQDYSVTPIEQPGDVFSSSSSVNSLHIPRQREQRYRAWRKKTSVRTTPENSPGRIPAIHLHEPKVSPNESIFMERKETHTKSICQLAVHKDSVALSYWHAQSGFDVNNVQSWSAPLLPLH